MGNGEKAVELFRQALTLTVESKDKRWEGAVLYDMALAEQNAGNASGALEWASRAIRSQGEFGDRRIVARSHMIRARAERSSGKLLEAKKEVETSLGIIEQMRASAGGDQSRATYLA